MVEFLKSHNKKFEPFSLLRPIEIKGHGLRSPNLAHGVESNNANCLIVLIPPPVNNKNLFLRISKIFDRNYN